MKKLKITGIILVSLTLLLTALYWAFLVPVDATTVCDNTFKLAKVEVSKQGIKVSDKQIEDFIGMNKERCIDRTNYKYRNTNKSAISVTRHSKCLANASSWPELNNCSK